MPINNTRDLHSSSNSSDVSDTSKSEAGFSNNQFLLVLQNALFCCQPYFFIILTYHFLGL